MAANTTFQLALYSSDLQTDILDLSVNNTLSLATQGGLLRIDVVPTALSGVAIATVEAFSEDSKLFLYNASITTGAASIITVSFDEGATAHLSLKAGEWALIPWTGIECPEAADRLDIHVSAATVDNTLEYGVFDV